MHRALGTGIALLTLSLGFANTASAESERRPRPSLVQDVGMDIERGASKPKLGRDGKISPFPTRLVCGPPAPIDPGQAVELRDEVDPSIDSDRDRSTEPMIKPEWTSCDPFDVNDDGVVDLVDFRDLLANFGTAEGDLTGNGEVDGEDLGLLLVRISNLSRD